MPDIIKDGKGRGYMVGVNRDNQLLVRSTSVEQRLLAAIDGRYYEATTGATTLTDATENMMIYLSYSNTSNYSLVIDRVFYDIFDSTGGSGSGILKYYRNPTITGGTTIVPNNTNFSSGDELAGTYKKSLTTMTGTVWWTAQISAGQSISLEEGRIVLPSGYSFGISITPPTGNTSVIVSVNVAVYEIDPTLIQ